MRRVATVTDGDGRATSRSGPTQCGAEPEHLPEATGSVAKDRQQAETRREEHKTDEQREAAGLELTRWEADALERFAPLVSATPRRLIRFVNVYRLIRTSLPPEVLERFVGEKGESQAYRALVTQLAVVTGAPDASMHYFSALEGLEPSSPLNGLIETVGGVGLQDGADHRTVLRILSAARDWPGTDLKVQHLRETARFARRYSFTAAHA